MIRTRRRFLLMATCGAASLLALSQTQGKGGNRSGVFHRCEHTSSALGTKVSITALHRDENAGHEAINAALAEIDLVEAVMSLYRADSQVCRLNATRAFDKPHPYLMEVLRYATKIAERTSGAFDVTVQPLWKAYDEARRQGQLPSPDAVAQAQRQVDWRQVQIEGQRITLRPPVSAITLNGIAQGFAADRALTVLRSHGVEHALIDAGELAPLGKNAEGTPWRVGIQHPRVDDAYIALVDLDNRCLATSGDYATKFSADGRYNHVFDPRSGKSPEELASVSVVAPTAMEADALSTACFVLGAEAAQRMLQELPNVDALFVLKNGRVLRTSTFPIEA
jgi:thiamine biosynthesis lipoprotein